MHRHCVLGFIGVLLLLSATPASADITRSCTASVTVDGHTYGSANDDLGRPVILPARRNLLLRLTGTSSKVIHDYQGVADIQVGPVWIPVVKWSGKNDQNLTNYVGTYPIFQSSSFPLAGLFKVRVSFFGKGGACEGTVFVKVPGSPLRTPVGVGAVVLTGLSGAGLMFARRPKRPKADGSPKGRPVLAGVLGLVLGLAIALDLQQFSVRPLDSVSLLLALVAGAAGVIWGWRRTPESRALRSLAYSGVGASLVLTGLVLVASGLDGTRTVYPVAKSMPSRRPVPTLHPHHSLAPEVPSTHDFSFWGSWSPPGLP